MNIITDKMKKMLPKDIVKLLEDIGRKANSMGCMAYIVGGVARDLLLGVKNLDLDIVVEGDAIRLGQVLASEFGAQMVAHKKFGTCSLSIHKGLKLDLVTARRETYGHPAALPTVRPGFLKDDLARRDFTINAMAVSIKPSDFGRLIDFFGGRKDLSSGRVRVMHDASFIDDPTRIFRAVRFEKRFGFLIEPHTLKLMKSALKKNMPAKISRERMRNELILLLKEKNRIDMLKRLAMLDILRFIHPELRFGRDEIGLFRSIAGTDDYLIYLMALLDSLSYNTTLALCNGFSLRRSDKSRILSSKGKLREIS